MPTITLSSPRVFSVAFFDLARIESETRSSEAKLTPTSPFENLESDITPPQVFLLHIQFLSAEPLRAGTRPCPSLHAALLSTPHPLAPSPVPHSRLGNHQPHCATSIYVCRRWTGRREDEARWAINNVCQRGHLRCPHISHPCK